jgi:trehalose 6-phosphate synthase/phosphatase
MDVISYRGPGAPGGVSSGLGSAWRQGPDPSAHWWFINDHSLSVLEKNSNGNPEFVMQFDERVIAGHYRYCNEFLWPLMHDLPEYASYSAEDRALYRKFNLMFAQFVLFDRTISSRYFVQDYQLALIPHLMRGAPTIVFWHIPWPKNVPADFVEPMAEIARGLLSAQVIGFHTDEYVNNFMSFVRDNLDGYVLDESRSIIAKTGAANISSLIEAAATQLQRPYVLRPQIQTVAVQTQATKLVTKPLGIDIAKWQQAALSTSPAEVVAKLPRGIWRKPLVLSVDRLDYTKAVFDRLRIIDQFFEQRPEMQGNISFMQVSGRSRKGLAAFDQYWDICQSMYHHVNERWSTHDWQPVHWMQESLNAQELSALYSMSDAMLVNPVRDGLNLTAKEFVACQGDAAGVLLLSPGAGAWHEIGEHALPAHPRDSEQCIASISKALAMEPRERRSLNIQARHKLHQASLAKWWRYFQRVSASLGASERVLERVAETERAASA